MIDKLLVLFILYSLTNQANASIAEGTKIPGWLAFGNRHVYRPNEGGNRVKEIKSLQECADSAASTQKPIAVWDSNRNFCYLYPLVISSSTMPSSYSLAKTDVEFTDEYVINNHVREIRNYPSNRLYCDIIEYQKGQGKKCLIFNLFQNAFVLLKKTAGTVPNWVSFPGSQIVQNPDQFIVFNEVPSVFECARMAEWKNKMTAVWYSRKNQCYVYLIQTTSIYSKFTMYQPRKVSNEGYLPFAKAYASLGAQLFTKDLSQRYDLSNQKHLEQCDYVLVDDLMKLRFCIQFDKSDQNAVVLMRKNF